MIKKFSLIIVKFLLLSSLLISCVSLAEETNVPFSEPALREENNTSLETSPPGRFIDEEIEFILPTYYIVTKDRDLKLGSITLALIFDRRLYPEAELKRKIELINKEMNSHFSNLTYSDIDTIEKVEKNTEALMEKFNTIFETGRAKKMKIIEMNIE